MREELFSTVQVLVNNVAGQCSSIDLEEHKIGSPPKVEVGDSCELVRVRAVNETVRIESRGDVLGYTGSLVGLRSRGDMKYLIRHLSSV